MTQPYSWFVLTHTHNYNMTNHITKSHEERNLEVVPDVKYDCEVFPSLRRWEHCWSIEVPFWSFSTRHLCCSFVLENAILAFGNGSDVKTGASQPGVSSPAMDNQNPHLATTTPGILMETEQNTLRAQIPAQVRWDGWTIQTEIGRAAMKRQLCLELSRFTCRWVGLFVFLSREQQTGGIYIICIIQKA